MGNIILITGGARSGKSAFAQQKAEDLSEKRLFVATCPVIDGEMDERIRLHQKDRKNNNWDCVEEEIHLDKVISNSCHGVILVDCLTMWMNNLVYQLNQQGLPELDKDHLNEYCTQIADASRSSIADTIFVTGEVGMGIVPENALARRYRDLLGWCNQIFASKADEAYFVSCGLPIKLK
ncbi:MAG: bifunctional adenosylcobinamide kinase/adenosylcobinamide-phosphate guanylyltransferase [Desulfotalea sp.]